MGRISEPYRIGFRTSQPLSGIQLRFLLFPFIAFGVNIILADELRPCQSVVANGFSPSQGRSVRATPASLDRARHP
jgi:hypothetical protein